jgi:hypothetical protein
VTAVVAVLGLLWGVSSSVAILIGKSIHERLKSIDQSLLALRLETVTTKDCEKHRNSCKEITSDHESRIRKLELRGLET